MSKKLPKTEDLVEMILDAKVMDVLIEKVTAIIKPAYEQLFKSLAESLKADIKAELHESLLKASSELIDKRYGQVDKCIKSLTEENVTLKKQLNSMEATAHESAIIVHGIPEVIGAKVGDGDLPFIDFSREKLGIEVTSQQIYKSYRLPNRGKDLHRPLVVQFVTKKLRDEIYHTKKKLRTESTTTQPQIYINEFLTHMNAKIYATTRLLVRKKVIFRTWTAGGLVFIRRTDSISEKPQRITDMTELEALSMLQ